MRKKIFGAAALFITLFFLASCSQMVNDLLNTGFPERTVTATKSSAVSKTDGSSSGDTSIVTATTNNDGSVSFTGHKPGETEVKVTGVGANGESVIVTYAVNVDAVGNVTYSVKSTFIGKKQTVDVGSNGATVTEEPTSADPSVATAQKSFDESGNEILVFTGKKPGKTVVTAPVKNGEKSGTAVFEVTVDEQGNVSCVEQGAETSPISSVDKFAIRDLDIFNITDYTATVSDAQIIKAEVVEDRLWVYSLVEEDAAATVTVTGKRSHGGTSDDITLVFNAQVEPTGAVKIVLVKSALSILVGSPVASATVAKDGVVDVERDGSKVVLTAQNVSAGASDSTVLTVATSSGTSYSYNVILSSYGRIVYGNYKGINFVANDSVNGNHINNNGDTITSVVEMEGFPRWHIPQMVTFLGNPTMTGYTFGGWFKASNFSGQAVTRLEDADFGDNTGITLYAKWTANKYKIVFKQNNDRDDASGTMADMNCNYDREYTLTKNTFDRTSKGVTWLNWNSQNDGSGTEYADQAKVKNLSPAGGDTVNMYARWKGNKYKVAFNSNVPDNAQPTVDPTAELTGEMADQNYECGIPQNLTANAYAIVGYTFGGWNTKADGTGENYVDSYNAYSLTTVDGDTFTMYAKWTPNANTAYTVRHLQQDYKSATELADTYTVKETETKSGTTWANTGAASKTYSGFTCEGVTQNHINADGSTVIDIKYRRHMFTVNFNVNNTYKSGDSTATESGSMASQSFVYGSPQNLRANAFAIVGYTFAGWATSSAGNKAYNNNADGSTASTSDGGTATLYAKWNANTNTAYKVYHKKQNTSRTGYVLSDTDSKTGSTGTNTSAATKSYPGFTAQSWSNAKIKANGSTEVTINYNRNSYKVVFHKNDGTSATSEQSGFVYEVAKSLNTNSWDRGALYSFQGWATSSGGAVAYSDGASLTINGNSPADKHLYAVWKQNLILNDNPQTAGDIVVYNSSSSATKFAPYEYYDRTGYSAAGWEPAGVVFDVSDRKMLGLTIMSGDRDTIFNAQDTYSAPGYPAGTYDGDSSHYNNYWRLLDTLTSESINANFDAINNSLTKLGCSTIVGSYGEYYWGGTKVYSGKAAAYAFGSDGVKSPQTPIGETHGGIFRHGF